MRLLPVSSICAESGSLRHVFRECVDIAYPFGLFALFLVLLIAHYSPLIAFFFLFFLFFQLFVFLSILISDRFGSDLLSFLSFRSLVAVLQSVSHYVLALRLLRQCTWLFFRYLHPCMVSVSFFFFLIFPKPPSTHFI